MNLQIKIGYEVRAEEGKTYHIYKWNTTGLITIQTNTNWNNANIVIHDEDIADNDTRNHPIIKINSNISDITINDADMLEKIKVNKQTTKIEALSGYGECLCIIYNADKKQYIRNGETSGGAQEDLFKIDNEGNVLNDIQWDFEKITSIRLIKIPEETITIENANFITILPENNYEQESGYFARHIVCNRSNTIIKNINHSVNNTERLGGPYFGFVKISYVADVILKDSSLYSHKYSSKSNYDLILEHSVNITIDNVTSNDIEDMQRWGITGSNYTKDVTYRNCTLNRIDAHCGVHNLTIENCTVGVKGLTLIGSGELNLKNVTRLGDSAFITLRSDYGSTWDGNINIEDCTYIPINSNQLISFNVTYDENDKLHDYGYDLYLPDINISNLKIEDEANINNSNEYYIFNNTSDKTGTENGDITNVYNLPGNVIVNSYETTSGKKMKLFSNKFYNSLDELGINLNMPLSDKEEVEITDETGQKVIDGTLTNQNVKLNVKETEGIQTTVKINDQEVTGNEKVLEQEGSYKIETIYQNIAGEQEQNTINVMIDKTAPQIIDVQNGVCYNMLVIPKSQDSDIDLVELYMNGEMIDYKLGNPIITEGLYTLIVKDKAQNETRIEFEIQYQSEPEEPDSDLEEELKPEGEDYKLDGQYIIGVKQNTSLEIFKQKLNGNIEYDVYRDDELLENEEIVATGDRVLTEYGETFYIIVKGDITKDGITNIKDLVKIRRNILGLEEFDEFQEKSADPAADEVINIKDLVIIRRIILGLE